ncbi:MAG: EAL domain-containing protein, partial [Sulfurimonas sp.]|nr:EAL domain-containing protein [Sulfurimonas sp.]
GCFLNIARFSRLLFPIFLLLLIASIGYMLISSKNKALINERYLEISKNMETHLESLIKEKQDAILQMSLAMSQDQKIKDALLSKDKLNINLKEFSLKLKNNTNLKNIWFQIVDAQGKSFYRSFSNKTGDSLVKARSDIDKMIKDPQIITSISAGKFAISLKTMVPIYEDGLFIGMFETLSMFDSIIQKMQESNEHTIMLIDKSYKDQLVYVDRTKFIQNYFIVNDKADEKLLTYIKERSIEAVINCEDNSTICLSPHSLVSVYKLNDELGKPMAYFIMSYNIDEINLNDILQVRNILFLVFGALLFVGYILFLYFQSKKNLIKNLNFKLEDLVKSKTKELTYLAHHDALTGLTNRFLFLEIVKNTIESAKRQSSTFSILFLDIDRFKDINDTYGHYMGDLLLKNVAKRLEGCIRAEGIVCRLAGDEFAILLKNVDEGSVIAIVDKIIHSIGQSIELQNSVFNITISIGISCFPRDGSDVDILMSNADTAMYKAKEDGRDTYQFYDKKMSEPALKRVILEKNLKIALQKNQFEAFYQPQIDTSTGEIIGAEALIRWNSPELGFVSPADFIPVAEQTKLIIKIDLWMMRETMNQLMDFQKSGIDIKKLSLNISAKQLEGKEMISDLKTILQETGFDASKLELEITEREMMANPEATILILNEIKKLGISISIDDFGTGHSSLAYIKRLPIDKLKIDKSFVDELPHDKEDVAIVRSVISIAKNLQIDIIAEGVETQEQKDFLLLEGCPKIQGYFYSKPLNASDYKEFLLKHNI